jgi:riboflavin biosynthesis pyrimidine reductase
VISPEASTVTRRIAALYGEADLPSPAGIVHVTSVFRPSPGDPLRTLRITTDTPTSTHDRFVLELARMRADAIVTTGRILRLEPQLRYVPNPELLAWRREILGRVAPPTVCVLTRGDDLDLDHPALHGALPALLYTSISAAARLRSDPARENLEIVSTASPSIRDLLDFLQRERAVETCTIEAGPTTSAELHADPPLVDELMLSIFEGDVPPSARGDAIASEAELARLLPHATAPRTLVEPSGPWTFLRRFRSR